MKIMTLYQKLIPASFLIVALSVAYYFVIYIPNNKKTNRELLRICLDKAENSAREAEKLNASYEDIFKALEIRNNNCYKLYPIK